MHKMLEQHLLLMDDKLLWFYYSCCDTYLLDQMFRKQIICNNH